MSLPNNLGAYEDCVKLLERALQSKSGIKKLVPNYGDGHQLYLRMHYTRKLLRDKSMSLLAADDPKYNTCDYDILTIRRPKEINGAWWVYIEVRGRDLGIVEELDADTTTGRAVDQSNAEPL